MAHTSDDITHPVVMVEAANLLQIVFFRGKSMPLRFPLELAYQIIGLSGDF